MLKPGVVKQKDIVDATAHENIKSLPQAAQDTGLSPQKKQEGSQAQTQAHAASLGRGTVPASEKRLNLPAATLNSAALQSANSNINELSRIDEDTDQGNKATTNQDENVAIDFLAINFHQHQLLTDRVFPTQTAKFSGPKQSVLLSNIQETQQRISRGMNIRNRRLGSDQ